MGRASIIYVNPLNESDETDGGQNYKEEIKEKISAEKPKSVYEYGYDEVTDQNTKETLIVGNNECEVVKSSYLNSENQAQEVEKTECSNN